MASSLLLSHPPTNRSTLFNQKKLHIDGGIRLCTRIPFAGKRQMAKPSHLGTIPMKKIMCLQDSNGEEEEEDSKGGGRRELMQAASIAGLSYLARSKSEPARADPIVPPDLKTCGPATVNTPPGVPAAPTARVNCCLLPPKNAIIDFKLPHQRKLHKRRPAHRVDDLYIAKFNKAYQLMKNLPSSDPRNFMRQADIHCAFCNGAYNQLGSSTKKIQVHFSWLFLPWHRWYLYFHERILGQLIGDPHFSLVFWNWDNQTNDGGNIMPRMFQEGSSLYDAKRNQNHLPPILNTLNISDLTSSSISNDQIIQDNLSIMYNSVVTSSTPDLFMGKKYSAGDDEPNVGGGLENAPHTAIHAWTGSDKETYLEDMGNFYSAARDPIFFAHHANVDRLWGVWNKIGGRRRDHTDPDFLNAEFLFYDENGSVVHVKAGDALDSSKLGVAYEHVKADKLWLNYEPQPLSSTTSKPPPPPPPAADIPEIGPSSQNVNPVKVAKTLVSLAQRPSEVPQDLLDMGLDEDELEEVLILEHVEVPRNVATHIAVFINLPDADVETPLSIAEYVGSFINVPHLVGAGMNMSTRSVHVRFGISDNIKRLGITNLSTISVTIVAKVGGTDQIPITLKGIKVEYE